VYPVLFEIGPFKIFSYTIGPMTIHTYGFFVAMGFLVGIYLATRQARKEGIPSQKIIDLGFYILLASIIGSRLFYILVNPSHYLNNPLDILRIWEGGLVFYGGILLVIPVVIWYVRRNNIGLWKTADVFAPSIAIGHAFGRIGCFFAGCCFGRVAESLPWSIIFTNPECLAPINIPLHPTQLYEAGGEAINFLILITLRKYKSFNGQLFFSYILIYSVLRFTIEFFRGDVSRGFILDNLSVAQGISILMFLTAVIGFLIVRRKKGEA
jgi:phosphatidylglycerol:prolipoprotein diacylglycerol transferase